MFLHADIMHLGPEGVDVLGDINAPFAHSCPQFLGVGLNLTLDEIGHVCTTVGAVIEGEHEFPRMVTSMKILPMGRYRPGYIQGDQNNRGLQATQLFTYDLGIPRILRIPDSPT